MSRYPIKYVKKYSEEYMERLSNLFGEKLWPSAVRILLDFIERTGVVLEDIKITRHTTSWTTTNRYNNRYICEELQQSTWYGMYLYAEVSIDIVKAKPYIAYYTRGSECKIVKEIVYALTNEMVEPYLVTRAKLKNYIINIKTIEEVKPI